MKRLSLRSVLPLLFILANLMSVFAQSDIMWCNKCKRRVWDSDSGRPRPATCPYCTPGGTGGGMTGLPTPRNSAEMGQYVAGSLMLGIIQGIEQSTAAQQEAARRAAEEAAAAERRRQERLRKAAEEARVARAKTKSKKLAKQHRQQKEREAQGIKEYKPAPVARLPRADLSRVAPDAGL